MNVVVRIMKWIMVVTATSLALASHAAGNAEAGAAQAATPVLRVTDKMALQRLIRATQIWLARVRSICIANCKCFNPESVTCP